jgi:transposase
MWNSRKVAEWIEHKTGRRVGRQRGWEYLRKLGNTPKVPRPTHAKKADPAEQEAFKKVSPRN